MAYTILVRKIDRSETLRRDNTETTRWFLESYDSSYPDMGVCSVNLEMNDQPLLVVLSDLESTRGVKLVGTDGTNRFILHKSNPPRVGLQDC